MSSVKPTSCEGGGSPQPKWYRAIVGASDQYAGDVVRTLGQALDYVRQRKEKACCCAKVQSQTDGT